MRLAVSFLRKLGLLFRRQFLGPSPGFLHQNVWNGPGYQLLIWQPSWFPCTWQAYSRLLLKVQLAPSVLGASGRVRGGTFLVDFTGHLYRGAPCMHGASAGPFTHGAGTRGGANPWSSIRKESRAPEVHAMDFSWLPSGLNSACSQTFARCPVWVSLCPRRPLWC